MDAKRRTRASAIDVDADRRTFVISGSALALAIAISSRYAHAQAAKAKIGIIGSGHIGGTIGGLWVKAGHSVMFSSRHPESLKDLVTGLGAMAKAGTVDQAIAFADVVFIAVPYGALPQVGMEQAAALKGKVVLDACNATAARDGAALADEVEKNGIGVTSQKYLPGTKVVRAFNTLSYMTFAKEANRAAPRVAIPIAGDDTQAVQTASGLVSDAGFDPVLIGNLASAAKFQRGAAGYGQNVSAAELRQKLSVAQ